MAVSAKLHSALMSLVLYSVVDPRTVLDVHPKPNASGGSYFTAWIALVNKCKVAACLWKFPLVLGVGWCLIQVSLDLNNSRLVITNTLSCKDKTTCICFFFGTKDTSALNWNSTILFFCFGLTSLFFSARRFASLPFKMSFLTPDDEFEL